LTKKKCGECNGAGTVWNYSDYLTTHPEEICCPACFGAGVAGQRHKVEWVGDNEFHAICKTFAGKDFVGTVYWGDVTCKNCLKLKENPRP
jgi:hypothetical protein